MTLLRIHQGIFRAILDPFGLGGLSRLLLMDVTSHISHIQIELSKKRRRKKEKKASSVFISSHRNVITEWVHKKYITKFFHKIQNKVSDNSSLLLVTLSSENQLPGIGSSCLLHLLAHVPPGLGSTWQGSSQGSLCPKILLAGTTLGRGSSWLGLFLAGVPPGWDSSLAGAPA